MSSMVSFPLEARAETSEANPSNFNRTESVGRVNRNVARHPDFEIGLNAGVPPWLAGLSSMWRADPLVVEVMDADSANPIAGDGISGLYSDGARPGPGPGVGSDDAEFFKPVDHLGFADVAADVAMA